MGYSAVSGYTILGEPALNLTTQLTHATSDMSRATLDPIF